MISIITQNLSLSTSTVGAKPSATSSSTVTSEQIKQAQEQGGGTFEDPSLGAATIVDLSSIPKPVEQFGELRRAQYEDAGRSMETIKRELGKIDALVAKRRPELAGKWDFQLVDGKFKVTGLNAEDAKWLERKLNANTDLKGAAQAFVSTAIDNLQASSSNPPRQDFSYVTGKMENYTFYNVKEQLQEKLSFRSLLTQADQVTDSSKITMPVGDRGVDGLAVVANMLTASNQPIAGVQGSFYQTKYDPHQA